MASKEQSEEWKKKRENQYLASQLGISYDELMDCDFVHAPITTNDGGIVGCLVQFFEGSPQEILNKIERLDNNCVHLGPEIYLYDPSDSDLEDS